MDEKAFQNRTRKLLRSKSPTSKRRPMKSSQWPLLPSKPFAIANH